MRIPVYVETNKGITAISSYRGKIDEGDLSAILSGELDDGWIKLEQVWWTENTWDSEREVYYDRTVKLGETPPYGSHNGEIWLRVEQICSLQPLRSVADEVG